MEYLTSPSAPPSYSFGQTVCVFLIGDRRYGLDIGLCGEVVVIDRVAPVPLSHSGVLGVFSLRGAPTALVDLAHILGLPGGPEAGERWRGRAALVLRADAGTLCAAPIQRVEAVIRVAPEQTRTAITGTENPAVGGFLEAGGAVVTLLDPRTLLERLEALRHTRTAEE